MAKKRYSVAVFLIDKAYGGPEEGGWWYTYGEPSDWPQHQAMTRWCHNKKQADRIREKMLADLAPENEWRRPISSVLSEGRYDVCIQIGQPRGWPEQYPHFE